MIQLTPSALAGVVFNCANCAALFGSCSDLAIVSATNKVSSASRPFTSADVGKSLIITGGTGFTKYTPTVNGTQPGLPQQAPFIGSVTAGVASLFMVVNNAVVAAPVGTVGSTAGSASVGYCTVWQPIQGDNGSFSQNVVGGVPTGINYSYSCGACGVTTSGTAPLSYLQNAAAGKHPGLIAVDGNGIVTATLAGQIWTPPAPF